MNVFIKSSDSGISSVTFYAAAPKHCSTVSPPDNTTKQRQRSMRADSADELVLRVKRSLQHIYCVIISTERETQQIRQTVVTAGRPRHHHAVTSQNSGASPVRPHGHGSKHFRTKVCVSNRAAWLRQPRPDLRIPKISRGYKSFPPALRMVISFIDKCVCGFELASPQVV